MTTQPAKLVCDLTAITPEQRESHLSNGQQLFNAALERQELAGGYAFRLPPEREMILKAAEFIALERLCCPFFSFALDLEPQGGPLWLRITGPTEAKAILEAGLDAAL
jgi:hypothetical protein